MQEKISTQALHIGMFVADLDRPWLDTPFPIQGFLVESPEQIAQLREFCSVVVVDWMRSAGEYAARAVANGEMVQTYVTLPGVALNRSVHAPMSPAKRLVERAVEASDKSVSFWEYMRELLAYRPDRAEPIPEPVTGDGGKARESRTHPAFLPSTVPIMFYANTATVGEELPKAEQVFSRGGAVLQQMVKDIRTGTKIEVIELEQVMGAMVESAVRNPDALMWVAHLRDQARDVYGHSLSVTVHLLTFGRHLGFPKDYLARLGMVGLLLDIGMLKVPKAILDKTIVLTSEEFDIVRGHVNIGVEILRGIPNLHPEILEGVAQHHERENGSGYPGRLSGDQLSTFGRMAAIVDTFTAMTNKRSYREPAAAYEVLRDLSTWARTFFNAPMVEQFIQSIGVFPAGSLVELSTGEVAVVVSHNKARRLKPRVLVITAPDKSMRTVPENLDLLYQSQTVERDPVHIVRGLPAGAYGVNASEYYVK